MWVYDDVNIHQKVRHECESENGSPCTFSLSVNFTDKIHWDIVQY